MTKVELNTINTMMGIFKEFERSSSGSSLGGGEGVAIVVASTKGSVQWERMWHGS